MVSGPLAKARRPIPAPHPALPQAGARGCLSFCPSDSFGTNLALEGTCKWLFVPHRKTCFSPSESVSRNSTDSPPAAPDTGPQCNQAGPGLSIQGTPHPLPYSRVHLGQRHSDHAANGGFSELKWLSACSHLCNSGPGAAHSVTGGSSRESDGAEEKVHWGSL